ncbi:MAG TPA: phosphoglycerate dehydrogenase [Burkholderiales bacterium]|nr:phosphoglycerate dehydrogenase [Burkholderiales bacterium]
MDEPFRILTLNSISAHGLKRFPGGRYTVGAHVADPDAILVRSQDMHRMDIPQNVKAVGRAGAGTNNIPVDVLSKRGVPVFNAPGANANAVKELVIAAMLIAARNLVPAFKFVDELQGNDAELHKLVEDGKKQFVGTELPRHTLGIIGLGKIGSIVADAAIKLGMHVTGYDPHITVDAAWSLPSQVRKAQSIEEVLKSSDFITLHAPLIDATRHMINAERLKMVKTGSILLNFARDGLVDEGAVCEALQSKRLRYYMCDFPSQRLQDEPHVVALPHLGASTREAEDNCAVMVVDQVREFLEQGNISNAVNFPDAMLEREAPYRVAIANSNVPNMLGQISTAMARAGLNIHNMLNKSKGEMAYTLVDVDSAVPQSLLAELSQINGVLAVRHVPQQQ